ncbi:two-component regulator propeller domain-containing protein [Motilimonas sp. 1_MG-2023]|uniref:two-component regulator propeller domain-containing protein n=1 Tax=Motilimonas sp. 1_MG-2023 TaxID=3062672 RepID=UPI0026E35B6A|nr:two-component regulator propeller domain-containing protein [Motilimonas sp. 1_MG-2023]MDO6525121.1 two-component regulator propeller domain-containing protein [Motilimonas sp. 1_MG-2023]
MMKILYLCCYLLFFICFKLAAFPYQGAHHFESIGLEQGLSQATAVAMVQDSQGYIWIGTQDGLNRYDGHNIVHYRYSANDEQSLSGNYISSLALDSQQRLWVLTPQGLNLFQQQSNNFKRFNVPISAHQRNATSPWQLKSDHQGRLWIKSAGGMSVFDPDSGKETILPLPDAQLPISDFIFSSDNRLWLTNQSQLYLWSKERQQLVLQPLKLRDNDEIITLASPDGASSAILWLVGNKGLYRFDAESQLTQFYDKQTLGINAKLTDLTFDSDGTLWLGSQSGLYVWSTAMVRSQLVHHKVGDRVGLKDQYIRQLYFDRTGVLWIGTRLGGVSKLTPQAAQFHLLNQTQGMMHSNVVMSLAKFGSQLWLGTTDGAISQIQLDRPEVQRWRPLSETGQDLGVIVDIEMDKQGDIWFASNRGLTKYLPEQHSFQPYPITGPSGERDNYISQLFTFRGQLWLASARYGLAKYDEQTDNFVFLEQGSSVVLQNISSVLVDGNQLWLGSFDGQLWQLSFTDDVHYELQKHELNYLGQALKLDIITTLYQDADGSIWVTNRNGLIIYQPGRGDVKFLSSQNGFPDGAYYEVLPDVQGNIWVTYAHGILQLNQQGELMGQIDSERGLPVNEFNGASAQSDDGTLFLGSVDGLLAFNISQPLAVTSTLPVVFTDIHTQLMQHNTQGTRQWHKENGYQSELALSYDNATIKLGFSDLDFGHSPSYFRYRLNGLDQHWNLAELGHNEAIYHQLDPGEYQFEVEVSKHPEQWTGLTNMLPITVATPWWREWWAYVCYLSSLLLIVYCYIRFRLRVAEQQARKLRVQVKQRTRTIEQLLRQKVRIFTHVVHDLKTPLALILAPVQLLKQEVRESSQLQQLTLVEMQTTQLLEQIDRLVKLTDSSSINNAPVVGVYDWQRIINSVLEQLSHSFELNRAKTKLDINGPLWVKGSVSELEVIVFHLLTYLLTLAKKGAVISTYGRTWDQEIKIWLSVQGLCLGQAQCQALLAPFHEISVVDALRLDEFGLMMLKEPLSSLHGVMTVEHRRQQSYIVVTLPLARQQSEHRNTNAVRGDLASWLKQKKPVDLNAAPILLLATSSKNMADFLRSLFSEEYSVLLASDHQATLSLAQKHLPKGIILDFDDAIDLCAKLKSNATLGQIPLLMLTTEMDKEAKLAAWQSGVYQILHKPFELAELRVLVSNMMQLSIQVEQEADVGEKSSFMARLDGILALDFADPELNINLIADKMGTNTKQLQRKLKQAVDMTPNEYLRQYRLAKAQQMLAEPLTIQEVALRCGFNSPSYFTSCYKKAFKQTPKQAQVQGVEVE